MLHNSTDKRRVSYWTSVLLGVAALLVGFPGHAADRPLSPGTTRAATCMIDVLKTFPGFLEAHIAGRPDYGTRNVMLFYTLRDTSGQVFHRKVEVYEHSSGVFTISMQEGLTPMLFNAWRPCGVALAQPSS